MTLEGAQSHIWCSKIGWQTVPCSWSIDGEAALTGSSPGTRDQQIPRRRGTQLLATMPVICMAGTSVSSPRKNLDKTNVHRATPQI